MRPDAVQVTPSEGSTQVPVNAVIRIESPEPLDFRTIVETGVSQSIIVSSSNQILAGFVELSEDGKILTFTPDAPFPTGANIFVRVGQNSIRPRDLAGNRLFSSVFRNPFNGLFEFAFSTSFQTDTTPPILFGITPFDGSVGAPINQLIVVNFNEPIYVNDINGVSLERFDGLVVATKQALVNGSTGVTLRPLNFLEINTQYRVKIDSTVTDSAGNAIPVIIETTFTTGDQVDPTGP